MSKLFVVSDIHIHAYPNRNPSNDYRLYQGSRTVAKNIIKVAKNNGCDYIVLAGDIIEKSILRPYVQAEVKLFLDTIMSNFKEGWIVWGNHDQDNKSSDSDITDSCLGIMLPSNLHYAHQKIVNIDGTSIGFSNWQPEFDLTWIPDKVDVLFTHAKICYNSEADGSGTLFDSQVLDESKFDLAICGDIHKPGTLGKYVSIGIPQRCKMGDGEVSTGIVYDCANKSYNWVDLNPDDNLMKFVYTPDLDKEGWKENEHTWYVYKQDNTSLLGSGQNIKVSAWEEIGTLVEDAIKKANLQSVHTEVLKNVKNLDSGEVDFNFTLIRFHCENWRSIDDITLEFKENDKILIQGSNGSGKSSLLSAIKYAFVDVADTIGLTSLKPFVQFGTKDCLTEVEFLYQGNICKIQRGTKTYGLWINGEPQKYSEKRLFEKDVRDRFPFVKYIDAFFFDADHHQFIGGMSPERKTEIVSKFLKLDRIDTYNETARLLGEQFKKDITTWQSKTKETEKLLGYINDKLSSIVVPEKSKQELEQNKARGLEIQRKNNEWNRFVNTTAQLQAQIQSYSEKLVELNQEALGFRSTALIDKEISELQANISTLQDRKVELGNIRINLNFKQQEFERLRTEGNNAWTEAQSIGVGKVCTHCGQTIKTSEALEAHKAELLQKVEDLKPKIGELKQEIQNLEYLKNNSDQELQNINSQISSLNLEVTKRLTEEQRQGQVQNEISKYTTLYTNANTQLSNLGVVERVDLPEHFMETMAQIESDIVAWNIWETSMADKVQKENELNTYVTELNRLNQGVADIDAYVKLTGLTGIIYEEIMGKLKDQFSDNLVHYVVTRKGKGNKEHLSLNPQYYNNGNWVDYDACSSGQKTVLDVNFLSKIVSKIGLIVMDEFLKCLDPERTDICIETLRGMNIGCLFLTSHMESIGAFYNKSCMLSLTESGLTKFDFK